MKKLIYLVGSFLIFTGCTQIITAPISVAGAVVGATIDVGSAGVRAVTGSDKDDD